MPQIPTITCIVFPPYYMNALPIHLHPTHNNRYRQHNDNRAYAHGTQHE